MRFNHTYIAWHINIVCILFFSFITVWAKKWIWSPPCRKFKRGFRMKAMQHLLTAFKTRLSPKSEEAIRRFVDKSFFETSNRMTVALLNRDNR